MNLLETKKVLGILGNIYNDRTIKEGKLKFEVYKIVKTLSMNLNDAINKTYELHEEFGLKDEAGNCIKESFDPAFSKKHLLFKEEDTEFYKVALKTLETQNTFLIPKDLYNELMENVESIFNFDYKIQSLLINPEVLLNYNLSCADLDLLVSFGIFRLNV